MIKNHIYSTKLKYNGGIFPELDQYQDLYLSRLGMMFWDNQSDRDWLLKNLENFDSRGSRGEMMDVELFGSKAVISDQYDKHPDEWAIEIDRASLIELVKAWDYLLKEDATDITLFRDDQTITMVGSFADNRPEFKKEVLYRCKGNALNKAEIWVKDGIPKCGSNTELYLQLLSRLLIDHSKDMNAFIDALSNMNRKDIVGERIRIEFEDKDTKLLVLDMHQECPYDDTIRIDRACMLTIAKAWKALLAQNPNQITLLRNDDYITMIGSFGKDKPEYKEFFEYRKRQII